MGDIVRINEDTWRIEDGFVRFFLFRGNERAALIDSGADTPDAREMAERLTDLPVILINTHTDGDHTSGNGAFEEIYMSPAEEEYYRRRGGSGRITPVRDGDVIDLGDRPLRIIDVPGHTPGSIAVLDEKNRILVSGDTVQDGDIFMFGEGRDIDSFIESLNHLTLLADCFDEIYPMHGSFPVGADLIPELIEGAQAVRSGAAEGSPVNMFGREVLLYKFPYAGFLCEKKGY